MLNTITIYAIRKTPSLPRSFKALLLSLALSDLGVGLLIQPLYVALLMNWKEQNNTVCSTYTAFAIAYRLFSLASFCGVMVLSFDRFLAIYLHLRYQELVTYKRVVAVVISTWVSIALLLFPALWILNITDMVFAFIFLFCFISATFVYYKIYFAVRRHTNEIQALQVQQLAQNGNVMANVARLSKSAVSTFYVYLVLLVCYLPGYGIFVAKIISSEPSTARKGLSLYTSTLVFLNSSLNPIIYCFKMRHIRHAVVDILRKIFTSRK